MELTATILLILQAIAFAFFTQILATTKGYPSTRFFWVGFFFSFLGLLFVIGLPTVTTPRISAEGIPQQQSVIPPPPQRSFRIATEGQDIGDLPLETIKQMVRVGKLTLQDYYFDHQTSTWRGLHELPDISSTSTVA